MVNSYRYEGKLYVLPHTVNVMLFFYGKDLFEAAGKPPPKTIAEYAALAKAFNTPARAGTISCQKPVIWGRSIVAFYLSFPRTLFR